MKKFAVALVILVCAQIVQAADMLTYHFEVKAGDKVSDSFDLQSFPKALTKASHEVRASGSSTTSYVEVDIEPQQIDSDGAVTAHVMYRSQDLQSRTQIDTMIKMVGGESVALVDFGGRHVTLSLNKFDVGHLLQSNGAVLMAPANDRSTSAGAYVVRKQEAPRFTPTQVWDDGKFTYFEFAKVPGFELPACVAMNDDGTTEMVNVRWDEKNSRLIVPTMHKHYKLVLGQQSVIVDRV